MLSKNKLLFQGYIGANNEFYHTVNGQIFLFDFNNPDQDPELLSIEADPAYKLKWPHGLNIWTDDKTGKSIGLRLLHKLNYVEGINA